MRQVSDGTSKTYIVGEKCRDPNHYETGESLLEDNTAYNGFDWDNYVSAWPPAIPDTPINELPTIAKAVATNSTEQATLGPANANFCLRLGSPGGLPCRVLRWFGARRELRHQPRSASRPGEQEPGRRRARVIGVREFLVSMRHASLWSRCRTTMSLFTRRLCLTAATWACLLLLAGACAQGRAEDVSAPAFLQIFEAEWGVVEDRMADIFKAGYGRLWLPPPARADSGSFSVGYDVFDRYDLGSPRSETLYGTETRSQVARSTTAHTGRRQACTPTSSSTTTVSAMRADVRRAGHALNTGDDVTFEEGGGYPGFVLSLAPEVDPNGVGDFHPETSTASMTTCCGRAALPPVGPHRLRPGEERAGVHPPAGCGPVTRRTFRRGRQPIFGRPARERARRTANHALLPGPRRSTAERSSTRGTGQNVTLYDLQPRLTRWPADAYRRERHSV